MTKYEYKDLLIQTSKDGGFPATNIDGSCAYRCEDGKKCAVGLILPDSLYERQLEYKTIDDLFTQEYLEDKSWIPDDLTVSDLYEIQRVHDSMSSDYNGWNHDRFVKELHELECFN